MGLRIDRASFLTLTFGMAGLACNTGHSPTVAASVVDIPPQPPQPIDGGAPVAIARIDDPSSKPQAVIPPGEDDDDDDDDMGAPSAESGVTLTPLSNPNGCGWVNPKTLVRPTAACQDDQGTAGSCNVMKTCSGFAFPKQKCEAYRRLLKPKVAQKALDCLAKLTDKQTCDACNAYRCGDLALKLACPDTSADASCVQITTKCTSVSMTECRTYLAGLNVAGRAKMVSCLVAKSGCGFGIYSCSEGLF